MATICKYCKHADMHHQFMLLESAVTAKMKVTFSFISLSFCLSPTLILKSNTITSNTEVTLLAFHSASIEGGGCFFLWCACWQIMTYDWLMCESTQGTWWKAEDWFNGSQYLGFINWHTGRRKVAGQRRGASRETNWDTVNWHQSVLIETMRFMEIQRHY